MKIKPLNKDIIVTPVDETSLFPRSIFIVNPDHKNNSANWFKVIAVADKVSEVKVNDIVLIKFGDHTKPIIFDDMRIAVTDETKILGILEDA